MEKARGCSSSSPTTSSSCDFSSSSEDEQSSRHKRHAKKRRRRSSSSSTRRYRHRTSRSRRSSSSSSISSRELVHNRKRDPGHRHGKDASSKRGKQHRNDNDTSTKSHEARSKKARKKKRAQMDMQRAEKFSKGEGIEKSTECISELQRPNNSLQVRMDAQEQQKAMIRHNAEIAKARLASGELQRAREEQAKMQRLYGTVDWRAKKKLRTENKVLERTIAAGKKLACLEEREHARMDAFRVALGLPTAEAQRQAEWRAQATQALSRMEACSKDENMVQDKCKNSKHGIIGPSLPP